MLEHSMKVVGRRSTGKPPTLEELNRFLELGIALRQVPYLVPKGVFRFKTCEEAQKWMNEETIKTLKRYSQDLPR